MNRCEPTDNLHGLSGTGWFASSERIVVASARRSRGTCFNSRTCFFYPHLPSRTMDHIFITDRHFTSFYKSFFYLSTAFYLFLGFIDRVNGVFLIEVNEDGNKAYVTMLCSKIHAHLYVRTMIKFVEYSVTDNSKTLTIRCGLRILEHPTRNVLRNIPFSVEGLSLKPLQVDG